MCVLVFLCLFLAPLWGPSAVKTEDLTTGRPGNSHACVVCTCLLVSCNILLVPLLMNESNNVFDTCSYYICMKIMIFSLNSFFFFFPPVWRSPTEMDSSDKASKWSCQWSAPPEKLKPWHVFLAPRGESQAAKEFKICWLSVSLVFFPIH